MAGYKGDTFRNDLLKLIFKGTAIANIADNAASGPLTVLYIALHTADPTSAGSQTSSEVAYTSYARVGVARGAGWTVTANAVVPAAVIDFAQPSGGSDGVATHWSVGVAASSTSKLLYGGPVTPNIAYGVALAPPELTVLSTITET